MGLRIQNNILSINALRNLNVQDRAQAKSLERLSSGLRINTAADDPSGLVISELLRAQISALKQTSENSQNAANLMSVADEALAKVSDLLIEIQDSIEFALNTGGASADQIAAEQDSVDQAIAAIDRIAATTRYGNRELLNGSAEFKSTIQGTMTNTNGSAFSPFNDVKIKSIDFSGTNTTRDLDLELVQTAQRAEIQLSSATASGGAVIKITGERGVAEIVIASGANSSSIAAAINVVADKTGVFATDPASGLVLRSENFGASEQIRFAVISGTVTVNSTLTTQRLDTDALSVIVTTSDITNATADFVDDGLDAQVTLGGMVYTATNGIDFSINTGNTSFTFKLDTDMLHTDEVVSVFGLDAIALVSTGDDNASTIQVSRTGLEFQLREKALSSDRLSVGIDSVNAADLGFDTVRDIIAEQFSTTSVTKGGFLSSIKSGQGNDLTTNAANALDIVQAAQNEITKSRGFLGAVVGFNVEPNIESIDVAVENLTASMSAIRDLDFAEETANFTRTQILFQSSIASLAAARLVPQSVLQLLG